jgi:hypothetical protein
MLRDGITDTLLNPGKWQEIDVIWSFRKST